MKKKCNENYRKRYLLSLALRNETVNNVCVDFSYCSSLLNKAFDREKLFQAFLDLFWFSTTVIKRILIIPKNILSVLYAFIVFISEIPMFPINFFKFTKKLNEKMHFLFINCNFLESFMIFAKNYSFLFIINIVLALRVLKILLNSEKTIKRSVLMSLLFFISSVMVSFIASSDLTLIPVFIHQIISEIFL